MHVSNEIRDGFARAVEEGYLGNGDWTAAGARALMRYRDQLLGCSDVMPRELCTSLDLPQGSTYAEGIARAWSGEGTVTVYVPLPDDIYDFLVQEAHRNGRSIEDELLEAGRAVAEAIEDRASRG